MTADRPSEAALSAELRAGRTAASLLEDYSLVAHVDASDGELRRRVIPGLDQLFTLPEFAGA